MNTIRTRIALTPAMAFTLALPGAIFRKGLSFFSVFCDNRICG